MEFSKISERQAWQAVSDTTARVRRGDAEPALLEWFRARGVAIERAVFPRIGLFDEGIFSGTLVTQDRRVVEYFVDLSTPEEGDFEDVTDQLGPKDPAHPDSDVKDLITMSLVFFDAETSPA